MIKASYPRELTERQAEVLEQAAMHVIKAGEEANAMLGKSGLDADSPDFFFVPQCGARLEPPPPNRFCGCDRYKGDGGPCINSFIDFQAPDFGGGPASRICGHKPSQHVVEI